MDNLVSGENDAAGVPYIALEEARDEQHKQILEISSAASPDRPPSASPRLSFTELQVAEAVKSKNRRRRIGLRRVHHHVRHVRSRLRALNSALLILYAVGFLFTGVGNAVFFKKMTNAMPNYGWFLSQVTCLVFVPIFGIAVIISNCRGEITSEMKAFNKLNFAAMGLLDCFSCVMGIIGGAFTSGPTQMVLGQAVIPITLFLSTLLLRNRHHALQYLGGFVIILGVIASKWPALTLIHSPAGSTLFIRKLQDAVSTIRPGRLAEVAASTDKPLFNVIFTLSAVPSALSQIYKEYAFRGAALDVNYMQYYVAVFQFVLGLIVVPLNSLEILGPERIPLNALPNLIRNGAKCLFLGEDSIVPPLCGTSPDVPPCDACAGQWLVVVTYIAFNVCFNVFTLLVVKHGGAAVSFLISALRLPLSSFCFYSVAVMGSDAVAPSPFDLLGLAVLLSGLAIYRYGADEALDNCEIAAGAVPGTVSSSVGPLLEQTLLPPLPSPAATLPCSSRPQFPSDTSSSLEDSSYDEIDDMPDDGVEDSTVLFSSVLVLGLCPHVLRLHRHRPRRPIYYTPVKLGPRDLSLRSTYPDRSSAIKNRVEDEDFELRVHVKDSAGLPALAPYSIDILSPRVQVSTDTAGLEQESNRNRMSSGSLTRRVFRASENMRIRNRETGSAMSPNSLLRSVVSPTATWRHTCHYDLSGGSSRYTKTLSRRRFRGRISHSMVSPSDHTGAPDLQAQSAAITGAGVPKNRYYRLASSSARSSTSSGDAIDAIAAFYVTGSTAYIPSVPDHRDDFEVSNTGNRIQADSTSLPMSTAIDQKSGNGRSNETSSPICQNAASTLRLPTTIEASIISADPSSGKPRVKQRNDERESDSDSAQSAWSFNSLMMRCSESDTSHEASQEKDCQNEETLETAPGVATARLATVESPNSPLASAVLRSRAESPRLGCSLPLSIMLSSGLDLEISAAASPNNNRKTKARANK